jgi:hypothetical protein
LLVRDDIRQSVANTSTDADEWDVATSDPGVTKSLHASLMARRQVLLREKYLVEMIRDRQRAGLGSKPIGHSEISFFVELTDFLTVLGFSLLDP